MTVAALAIWIITLIIGAYLLAAGIGNEHRLAAGAGAAQQPEPETGHPLLEFCHPALGLIGLMFWLFFVVTTDAAFAWSAFGILAATVLAGITWLISGGRGRRSRRRERPPRDPVFPRHLVLLHGFAVTCTFVLVLIVAVTAGHG